MSPSAIRPAFRHRLVPLLLVFSLTACGSGEDSLDVVSGRGNSFPAAKNPIDDFSESSTGDSSNAVGLEPNQVRVTLEVPTAVAPDAELTRRNLRIVKPDRLSVYRSDNSLQMLDSVAATQFSAEGGRVIIEFDDGQPLGPDVLIEAAYGNTIMRAFAADSDRDIKVNPFSEFLVRNALGGYSPSAFDQVMACVNSSDADNLCLNKYVWSTLSDQIQDFEIEIPGNLGLTGALDLLGNRADFRSYVENMAEFALLDSASSGKISAQSADYNSVFLGLELGQSFLVSSQSEPGQWGTRLAREEFLQDDKGTAYVYPGMTLTSFDIFNIRVTSLASDIPYERATVAQTAGNEFFDRQNDYWDLNSHATAPGAATVEDQLRLLAGRSLYQSVTGRGSSRIIGWTRNPYYLDAYLGGGSEDPDRVLQGYFSAGKAIELQARSGELKRLRTLEDHYLSVLELDLARAQSFDLGQLSGKIYNLVTFATRLQDPADGDPVRMEAGVGSWSISGQTITQTLSDVETLSRDDTGVVTRGTLDRSGQRRISHRTATLSTGDRNIGRLNLDISQTTPAGGRPEIGVGAATPDASLLAFNLDNGSNGDGLLVAAPEASAPSSGRYRIQGLATGMSDDLNRLRHFADAVLTITGASAAELTTAGLDVIHTVADERVSRPTALAGDTRSLTLTDLGGGRIRLEDAGTLVLEGFATPDQEQLFLRLVNSDGTEQQLGLLMATRLP